MERILEMWLADLFSRSKEDPFISLLGRHAGLLHQVARAFNRYVTLGSPEISNEIKALETEGDEVLALLTTALRDAFITPFDRHDIYNLGETIDDMIDYINNAAREIALFRISATTSMLEIALVLESAAEAIACAVIALKSNPQEAWVRALEACHAESIVEDKYRHALAELFEGSDIAYMLKAREIYRHLSNSADRAEAIGRVIGKIVIKTT